MNGECDSRRLKPGSVSSPTAAGNAKYCESYADDTFLEQAQQASSTSSRIHSKSVQMITCTYSLHMYNVHAVSSVLIP